MIFINRQSYLAELSKLLGFMSAWDRRDTLAKYEALFDEAADEAELIDELGSPTKAAIALAMNYVPSPAPAVSIEEKTEPEAEDVEPAAVEQPEGAEEAPAPEAEGAAPADEPLPEVPAEPAPDPVAEPEAEEEPAPERPRRKVRAFGLIAAILFGLVIGLPIALVLICIGIPFIVLGVAVVGLAVWAVLTVVGMLAMISDILIVIGVGLVLCALGLLLAWFGLWLSFELGYLWISGVVLRLGRALSYKKEVAAE